MIMGYFNIKLDNIHTEKLKKLRALFDLNTDETFEKLIDISTLFLEQQLLQQQNQQQRNSTSRIEQEKNSTSKNSK